MKKADSVLRLACFFVGMLTLFGWVEPSPATAGAASVASTATPGPLPSRAPRATPNPIRHVIVIVQENRSFDNLFHDFAGADTVEAGRKHDGTSIRLRPVGLAYPADLDHSHEGALMEYDHGKMDGWDLEQPDIVQKIPKPVSTLAYSYVPASESRIYRDLAKRYVLGDRTFQSLFGPSFAEHQYLIAGQSASVVDNPDVGSDSNFFWGCDSPRDARALVNNQPGRGVFPCFTYRTIADELDAAGIRWHYYAPPSNHLGAVWSAFDAIKAIRYGPDWENDVVTPEHRVLDDIAHGTLPQVSWVIPTASTSDHAYPRQPRFRNVTIATNKGPEWVASIVNAVGQSPYWKDSAIFVVWDDWGGWYDHVAPPQLDAMGLGFRVPLLVVSPYAKRGYVSHAQHEFASILKFIEQTYGLGSLGTTDLRADAFADCFDFSKPPRTYAAVRSPLDAAYFERTPLVEEPPDDD